MVGENHTEYTPRRPRSSDQALRGDFSSKPQKARSGIASFAAIIVHAHTYKVLDDDSRYGEPMAVGRNGSRLRGFDSIDDQEDTGVSPKHKESFRSGIFALLSDVERDIIHLQFFEGVNPSEIAQRLHMPLGDVRKTMAQAFERIQERFDLEDLTIILLI